jgi:hypothetical protein
MRAIRELRRFSKLVLTAIVLVCFGDAVAQTTYSVTDLGVLNDGFFSCAMGLNNHGWTESTSAPWEVRTVGLGGSAEKQSALLKPPLQIPMARIFAVLTRDSPVVRLSGKPVQPMTVRSRNEAGCGRCCPQGRVLICKNS